MIMNFAVTHFMGEAVVREEGGD